MVGADRDLWTRTVGWLKVLLPLGALVILSLTFLLARNINPEDAIPYADVDVEERLREPRMTAPVFSGITDDGASLRVTGDEARPENPAAGQGASGRIVFGEIDTPDGAHAELEAVTAQLDLAQQSVLFTGDVLLRHSQGYTVRSDRMTARLDQTDVRSLGPVVAEGPPGRITADEMVLMQDTARPDGYVLVFNGSVKLIYQPKR